MIVTELGEFGEAKRTTLAYEPEKVLMNKFGDEKDRIRDDFKNKHTSSMAFGHRNILFQVYSSAQVLCEVQDSRLCLAFLEQFIPG